MSYEQGLKTETVIISFSSRQIHSKYEVNFLLLNLHIEFFFRIAIKIILNVTQRKFVYQFE